MSREARCPASGASNYLAVAGAAGVAGAMVPSICINIAGSKGKLSGAGAVLCGAGAAGAAAGALGIIGKNGIGAACTGTAGVL